MFISAVMHIDKKDRNKGVASNKSTKELLMKHLQYVENMQLVKAHAAMDVRLRWI